MSRDRASDKAVATAHLACARIAGGGGPSDDGPAIRCRALCCSFGDHKVLESLDLAVPAGRCIAIMGPSGSGKTTLLHILAGLITPDSGDVEVAGLDLVSASARALARQRREKVSMVFQFGELLPELNVAENVSLPMRLSGRRPGDGLVQDALEAVGLHDPRAWPAQLSGGEMQRAAVARALITRPAVLLCDEPTGSLDAANSEQVVRLLLKVAHQSAATLIVSTHDPAVAERMDDMWLLNDGGLRSLPCR